MKKKTSLRKWLRTYWIGMFAFLSVVYFLSQSFLLMTLTDGAEENIQKSIRIADSGIDNSLVIVDSFIYESLYSGTTQSASQLYYALKNEQDPVTLANIRTTVTTSLQSIVTWSDMIDFIMIYTDRETDNSWLEVGDPQNYATRSEVKKLIKEKIDSNDIADLQRYMIYQGNNGNYMIRLLKIQGSYLVVCVSEKEILNTLQQAAYDENSISFAAESDGSIIFSSKDISGELSIADEGTYIVKNGKPYLQTGYVSEQTGYYFGMLTEKRSIVEEMWFFRVTFFVVFTLILFLVPISFYIIRSFIEKPIETIADTMNEIAEGDLDAMVDEQFAITELDKLVHAFNHMIERIMKLKIEKYEVKLEAQKATMQYLQLQIKPHFFANTLNIIYSLAEQKRYDTIQKISKAIVNYSRYMFHDASELVELQKELEHLNYYMEIQEIRYMKQIYLESDIPENTMSALIPPFIIQSFVENSVKYAFSSQKNCNIRIHVETDERKEILTIEVRDDGNGYSEELLNLDWEDKNEEGHVGLTNVYRRLKLIYEDNAGIELKNDYGAVSIVRIPYIALNDMDFEDDF